MRARKMKLVLMVEDEYGNAEVLQLLLEAEGYRVAFAANGKAGLELLAGEKPAVIISDFMMPHLTGAELGQAVRANPLLADIPFVMVSGTTESVVQDAFAEYDAFVPKPFVADALLALVSHLIATGRPKRRAAESADGRDAIESDPTLQSLLQRLKLPPA
jgi:CheY-like chemotaxis protein